MTERRLDILLVDDDPAHAEAIRRAFRVHGADTRIRVVGTVREYRDIIGREPPDVAILDLNLPDGRAVDVLTSPPEEGRFPILVMTTFEEERIAVEAMEAGALDYMVKSPESFSAMPRIVNRALREWELTRARRRDGNTISRLHAVLRAVRKVNQLIVRETDQNRLVQKVCDSLMETRGYPGVWISLRHGGSIGTATVGSGFGGVFTAHSEALGAGFRPPCWDLGYSSKNGLVNTFPEEACGGCSLRVAYVGTVGMVTALVHGEQQLGLMGILAPSEIAYLFSGFPYGCAEIVQAASCSASSGGSVSVAPQEMEARS